MSAYQALIIPATALGALDAVALLQANLDQEVHTSEELQTMLQRVVA
jgi:ferritin-like metal-binding protein YciE